MADGLDRLKVLINSSTPIVVMETSEETRVVNMVRTACSELKMATLEWSIADGLLRSGTNAPPEGPKMSPQERIDQATTWTRGGSAAIDSTFAAGYALINGSDLPSGHAHSGWSRL